MQLQLKWNTVTITPITFLLLTSYLLLGIYFLEAKYHDIYNVASTYILFFNLIFRVNCGTS